MTLLLAETLRRGRKRPGERGLSLIEVLFSLLILLVITLSIIPLFSRAIQSNKRGAQASQTVSFLNSNIEEVNQVSINYDEFNEPLLDMSAVRDMWDSADETSSGVTPNAVDLEPLNPCDTEHPYDTCDFYGLPSQYWITGPEDPIEDQDLLLGDEGWYAEANLPADDQVGKILWVKDVLFYSYDLADIHQGTPAAAADPDAPASTVVQLGNPRLFDAPRSWNDSDPPDIREVRVTIRSAYEGSPVGPGMLVTVGHYRVF